MDALTDEMSLVEGNEFCDLIFHLCILSILQQEKQNIKDMLSIEMVIL